MALGLRVSPGRCPICDADHTTCKPVGYRDPIRIVQLPSRDRAAVPPADLTAAPSQSPTPETPRQRRQRRAQQRRTR